MAECQNAQENEEDICEDCVDIISQLNLITNKKENKKQEVLTPGEDSQSSNETDQSERSNDKNSLSDSQPEQPESATETGNHNLNDNVPTESEQERHDAVGAETTPYKLPPTEPNTVHFYLLILGKSSIKDAEIRWAKATKTEPKAVSLHLVSKENSLWYCAVTFPQDPTKFPIKYKYCLNEHPKVECKEEKKRTVTQQFQFDVFIFPDNRYFHGETLPSAAIWYAKWLLKLVNDSTISPILTSIQCLYFKSLNENHMEVFVSWILEQTSQNSTTDIQRFYLCMILSHLRSPALSKYSIGNKKACDRLLQCFTTSAHSNFLSTSDRERLKATAVSLVKNSSSPTWLTLAALFYPYLGIKFLLEKKNSESLSHHKYDSEEYKTLVALLLSCLKVDSQEDDNKKLLKYVMKSSPTLVEVVDLFQRSEISKMFTNDDEKVDFFVKFIKEHVKKKGSRERLTEFHHMPEKIRSTIEEVLNSNENISADKAHQNKHEDGVSMIQFTEETPQLYGPLAEEQENNNPEATTHGERDKTHHESGESKRSNDKIGLNDGSQIGSHEIHGGRFETTTEDANQKNQVPTESQTGQHEAFDSEIHSQPATENGKNNPNTVTEAKSTPQPEKNSLYVKNVRIPHTKNPQTPTEPNTVCFYLLTPDETSVDFAYIHFGSDETYPLYSDPQQKGLWYCILTFTRNPIQGNFQYTYSLQNSGREVKLPGYGKLDYLSKPAWENKEQKNRHVKHKIQVDVFCSQDKEHSKVNIWYAKWLLKFVNDSTISPILTSIRSLDFTSVNEKQTKELVSWILEQASQNSTTNIQRFYLCMILSHLRIEAISKYPIRNKKVFDRLLQCFSTSAHSRFLSTSDRERLKTTAVSLVENSSSPGWLTLAAHFYSYLGIEFLLDKKKSESLSHHKYDSKEYKKLVALLLSCLKVDNKDDHNKLLKYVMKSSPTLVEVVDLFQRPEISEMFANEEEKDNYFVAHCKNKWVKSKNTKRFWERLPGWPREKFRSKFYNLLFSTLLDYTKSDDELKDDDIQVLVELILSIKRFGMDQFIKVLKEFAASKSLSRQELLPQILDAEPFNETWHEIPLDTKVDICKSWVLNRVTNLQLEADMVVAVYQSIENITRHCSLEVSAHVIDKILESLDAVNILDVSVIQSVEKLSPAVTKCYISHIRKILTPQLVKKSSQILKDYSTTNLGQELLLCALEIIEVPEIFNDKETDEDDFKKILDWLDIWIILLDTNGAVRNKKYEDGKKICQLLKGKIEKGDFTLDFVNVFVNEKEKVSLLCASVHTEKTAQFFQDKITEMMGVVEDFRNKIQLLESTINHAKELWTKVYSHPLNESDTLIEAFRTLKQTWFTRKIYEMKEQDMFFGELLPDLLDQAKVLNPWIDSIFFMAMAKTSLQEPSKSSSNEDKNEQTAVRDLRSVINFLATKTFIKNFKREWTAVLNNPGLCTLATMTTLLKNVEDLSRLDEELDLLRKSLEAKCSSDVKSHIDDFVKYPKILTRITQIVKMFEINQLGDRLKDTLSLLSKFETTLKDNKTNLAELQTIIKNANSIMGSFSGENVDSVIEELSKSSTLLDFITKIADEDIRFFIDAAEEHSDQFVSESLVSDFIDVHSFLAPLIKKTYEEQFSQKAFLEKFQELCLRHNDIAEKIKECSINVNSIRGLYTSIANRGDLTEEIIRKCLTKGEYLVSTKDGKSEATMSYALQASGENKVRNHSLSHLCDLRSRAHLIVSSQKKSSIRPVSTREDINFEDFITQVNLLAEISTLLTKLRASGYSKYQNFEQKIKDTNGLQTTRNSLKQDLENWENELKRAREKFYFLNYYHSDQICTLYNFFINGLKVNEHLSKNNEVLSLIHFVDRTIKEKDLKQHQESAKKLQTSDSNATPNLLLSAVGEVLEKIFTNSKPDPKSMPNDRQGQSYVKPQDRVTEGEVFVATLEPKSQQTVNVLLALYESTSKAFPEPYQIVFCSSRTTWEEIHLLLQRCFTHSKWRFHKTLFCIVNVELLTNKLQFKLVDTIKEKQKCDQNGDYQLALICRGGDHHRVVEQFAENSHHIAGMTDLTLSGCLKSGWPNVKMFTSSLPGLGKTEEIKHEARENRMNVVSFSISGPFQPYKLIERLKKLELQKNHCLHLDIGEVSDPLLLDSFLFQLIVIGMVSAGNQFYHLPTTNIYIELANSLKDWLRESLVVSMRFTRVHVEWKNYENLRVSDDITSDVQVVCQYLELFDSCGIESKEVHFSGPNKSKPLSTKRCRELLAKHFSKDADVTFTTLNTFLAVLADQLLKFSKSAFFKIKNIKRMAGGKVTSVRKDIFEALLDVSKQFACRAITARLREIENISQEDSAVGSTTAAAQDMVERVAGMIKWEDNNHLLVVFQGLNSQAITAIYRELSLVPSHVRRLLESQAMEKNENLEDFKDFTQEQLQEKLEKIACTKLVEKKKTEKLNYTLTSDNILKMVLIILRVRANVPVIIMGETGCGKTSLVRYLANTCGVQFFPFHLHAGISEEEITAFVEEKECDDKYVEEQKWIFLDEINTCDHLGLINDIMCHHSLHGRPLSKNLVFLAACNPYKLRTEHDIKTAGLKGKNISDQYSKLVYRVYQLPEAMIDYVWDFGSLGPKDERVYIERMVKDSPKIVKGFCKMVVGLLVASQNFIRDVEKNNSCVSLRDVDRCIRLIKWFEEKREERQNVTKVCPKHLQEYHKLSEQYNEKPMIKSIVLGLTHCYLSRLPTTELRKRYRTEMINQFSNNGNTMTSNETLDTFEAILRMEEEDYLDRMKLPAATAKNAALRENIFVMLVCILNRIPIFVVGQPGCSKSLSIQLIRSHLRGRDSEDPWFQKLPQLYFVSYQGSESSTSEGIMKVFEKARKYKSYNKDGSTRVLPVVLLDEVGLAENSKNNPLKVLHSLLEPGDKMFPDVAVVGISNWSLDAAKMNRAIHLSRPEPSVEELQTTNDSLHQAEGEDNSQCLKKEYLDHLAEAYFKYQNQQTHKNFHGLRDYYALVKSLIGSTDTEDVNTSLQRNFGGLPDALPNIQKIFLDKLTKPVIFIGQDDPVYKITPVTELIEKNVQDPHARHLMLITNGDAAIVILKQSLAKLEREIHVIYGSRFEEDLCEDYNYRILSSIILHMERDSILILKDLESIYGSLYDMLNQNYTVVGNKKNCRVALGPYSNPMCQVHDRFRCIVLIDQHQVDYSDPPFLNRFEKQVLRFSNVLTKDQQSDVTAKLDCWVKEMSTVEGFELHFSERDLFIGFHQNTLASLVFSHCHDNDCPLEEILENCKDDLMWTASPDGVLRTQKCKLFQENSQQVKGLNDAYFQKPLHQGFAVFIQHVMTNHKKPFFAGDEIGSKTIVMTFSSFYTDIRKCLQLKDDMECQVERLSSYKSETMLSEKISEFWNTRGKALLVLQCKPEMDGEHLMLARCIIEEKRNSYKKCVPEKDRQGIKHVCIVIHVQRREDAENVPWQFSFMCGWRQVFLDVLEAPPVPLNEILGKKSRKLLISIWQIKMITMNNLLWSFTCINYTRSQRPLDAVLYIAKNLFRSNEVSKVIEKLILESIHHSAVENDEETYLNENWPVEVAFDRELLAISSPLYSALERSVSNFVRNTLAKIVFFLEKENAWSPHLLKECGKNCLIPMLEDLWCKLIMDNTIFTIENIPQPLGSESYLLNSNCLELCMPFIQVVYKKIDTLKELFLADYALLQENKDNFDENGRLSHTVWVQQLEKFSKMMKKLVPTLYCCTLDCHDLYMKDVFDIVTADFSALLDRSQRVSLATTAFISEVKQILPRKDILEFCTLIHIFVWLDQEQIFDLLRLVECCSSFIPALLNKTDDVFYSSEEVVFVEGHETGEGVGEGEEGEGEEGEGEEGEGEEGEDSESFEDNLVMACCEKMFPSSETVEKNGGLESWMRNASLLLSLAFKISAKSPAFHYLRFCVDFARIICTGDSLSKNLPLLLGLNEIGMDLRPEYLDHQDAFKNITSKVIEPLKERIGDHKTDKQAALQKFLALFYGRCIDTNVDTGCCGQIIEHILSLDRPELAMIMSPVVLRLLKVEKEHRRQLKEQRRLLKLKEEQRRLLKVEEDQRRLLKVEEDQRRLLKVDEDHRRLLKVEEDQRRLLKVEEDQRRLLKVQIPGIFRELITNPDVIEECPCFQIIDKVFKACFEKKLIHHDSYPAVMICDLIQNLLHFEDDFKIEDIDCSDCEILTVARSASRIVSLNSDAECGLIVLSAVSFLRKFFTMIAKFVAGDPHVLNKEHPYINLMVEINSLLQGPKSPLQMFFMKQLYEDASLSHLQKWFKKPNALSSIEELWHEEEKQKKTTFTSVFKCSKYEEAQADYFGLKENDEKSMQKILENFASPEYAFAFLGILINIVYLERAVRKLNDTEERLLDWFAMKVTSLPPLLQELLLRVINRRDFQCPQLQLSPESSVKEVEMALLVLHIACVVVTGGDDQSPIHQYLTHPERYERSSVLAHSEEDMHSVFEYRSSVKEPVSVTCACGSRLDFQDKISEKICPNCHAVLNNKTDSSNLPETSATLSKWGCCTKQMNPAAYRALHLIVYSTYYAGIALGISSEKNLLTALKSLHGDNLKMDSTSPANFCFENVKSDLSCLMSILSCKERVAIKTMHLVIEKSSDLMRSKNILSMNDCSTPEMLREWESQFSQLTETVFLKARETSNEIKEMMKLKQMEENTSTLECRILELDDYPVEAEEQNKQLKRLFRVTKQPSFEDFRSAFLYSPQDVQVKHSFLTLFFARFDQLSMIRLLHDLLKWSRIVSSSLTFRISREDARSKYINDFIKGHLTEKRSDEEVNSLQTLFDNFKKSWNEMRNLVNQKLKGKEMPRLTETDCVAYCITESDFGIYLKTAIEILVSNQNSILNGTISLSSSRQYPVLSFLENGNFSSVPSISIQNVKENGIISFQWSDDLFLQHAQNNLEYGKGREITYDFERIEMELANEILFGKCYLTGTLNKFIFAKELFHSCGTLLTEIRSLVKESPDLPKEVLKCVTDLKENRIKDAEDLLRHIEVLIYLLKRKSQVINAEMTLEDLVTQWSTVLPSPFPVIQLLPQARRFIQIKHIPALYEALEDVLADGPIDGLDGKFRHEMSDDMKKKVCRIVKGDNDQLKTRHFLKVLRRFVFRHLSNETKTHWPDENKELQSCLQESSLWSRRQPPDAYEIPQDVALKNIHSLIKHLEKLLEPKIANTHATTSGQNIKVTKKRRQLVNYSKM